MTKKLVQVCESCGEQPADCGCRDDDFTCRCGDNECDDCNPRKVDEETVAILLNKEFAKRGLGHKFQAQADDGNVHIRWLFAGSNIGYLHGPGQFAGEIETLVLTCLRSGKDAFIDTGSWFVGTEQGPAVAVDKICEYRYRMINPARKGADCNIAAIKK